MSNDNKEFYPIYFILAIFCVFMTVCFWLHCYYRPQYPQRIYSGTTVENAESQQDSTLSMTQSEAVLQQITSYYESIISVFVMIITIVMATSLASIFFTTRKQIKGSIEEAVLDEFSKEHFNHNIEEIITVATKKRYSDQEIIEMLENNPDLSSRLKETENNIRVLGMELLGKIQDIEENNPELFARLKDTESNIKALEMELRGKIEDIEENISEIKTTYAKKRKRNSDNGIQKENNNE